MRAFVEKLAGRRWRTDTGPALLVLAGLLCWLAQVPTPLGPRVMPGFGGPVGLAVRADGVLLVACVGRLPWGQPGAAVWEITAGRPHCLAALDDVVALAAGADGSVYAADGYRVLQLDRSGIPTSLSPFGYHVGGIAMDRAGRLWIADGAGDCLYRRDPRFRSETAGYTYLCPTCPLKPALAGVAAADDGSIYAVDVGCTGLWRLSPAGVVSKLLEGEHPQSVAADARGNVYAATRRGVIWKLDNAGHARAIHVGVELARPFAAAPDGTLYVATANEPGVLRVGARGATAHVLCGNRLHVGNAGNPFAIP